ncbi:hypothetical protein [Streptomyces huiliensis]|uniref:hypothetical protein n=1 Tax=Streptomyces huiliensis TaxID=2876027 RepID=UPI001CBDA60A|nr:hypothetical protein [Streptomyces huiliensis]MBZ4319539.1 hypothetical protein [Streptomyces huiliensis]
MGMWIGRPGAMREITDGATSYDRSPEISTTEFRALSGAVTTWTAPVLPRRLKIQWEALERPDYEVLDRLVRRLDGPGPVAVIDPLTRNLLGGAQSAGTGSLSAWSGNAKEMTLYGGAAPSDPVTVSVDTLPSNGLSDLNWIGSGWPYVPVTPGMTVTWWVPGLIAAGAGIARLCLFWHDRATGYVSGQVGPPERPLVGAVPTRGAFVRPAVRFNKTGVWEMGFSALTVGDTSAALLAGDRPYGEGTPPYSVTGYSHAATAGDGRYRDVSLDLVEVTSAAG